MILYQLSIPHKEEDHTYTPVTQTLIEHKYLIINIFDKKSIETISLTAFGSKKKGSGSAPAGNCLFCIVCNFKGHLK